MSKSTRFTALALVLTVQFAGFAWLIVRYERIVSDGVECRFRCSAYDPSDPFRGRYLRMSVEVPFPLSHEMGTNYCPNGRWLRTCPLAVKIDPNADEAGFSRVVDIAKEPRDDGLWVRRCGVRRSWGTNEVASVVLPNRYFLNENLAAEAERIVAANPTNCVAIYRVRNGDIVLTGIEIDGRRVEDVARQKASVRRRAAQHR